MAQGKDLIDTLWNVKSSLYVSIYCTISDLIDTLWNVKAEGEATRALINARFNRYIVECKAQ